MEEICFKIEMLRYCRAAEAQHAEDALQRALEKSSKILGVYPSPVLQGLY